MLDIGCECPGGCDAPFIGFTNSRVRRITADRVAQGSPLSAHLVMKPDAPLSHPASRIRSNLLLARTVRGIPPSEHQVPYNNIGELLRTRAEAYADKTWLIFYSDADETRGIPGDR